MNFVLRFKEIDVELIDGTREDNRELGEGDEGASQKIFNGLF
jgi:hypothetical protein